MNTIRHSITLWLLTSVTAIAASASVIAAAAEKASVPAAGTQHARPTFTAEGNVNVPAFVLPPSELMSPQAVQMLKMRAGMSMPTLSGKMDIATIRQGMEAFLAPSVQAMKEAFPANIIEQQMAGVRVRVVTPKGKPYTPDRVLINLHGGAFSMCAEACAMLESIPIASVGSFKVVTVDYRQGPENVFPAASEDIATVYKELLKTYKPSKIGIYGCSAGGVLAGEAAAWLLDKDLPVPGALGIFGQGAGLARRTDSAYIASYVDGSFPPPPDQPNPQQDAGSYFTGADIKGPLVSPMYHLDVLRKFPPTLLISGTRAMDMSSVVYTNSQLLKADVESQLLIGEGMGHCYINTPGTPEANDAFQIIAKFFNKHLGR